ncbi:hypothetical protein B566_EDAN017894 [Ephemera danica]|nr:hypothetical protein B566_EDAN017894 [Ephemera danica]
MSESLDTLVKILPEDKFVVTTEEFKGKNVSLLKRKGVYPYEYTNSWKRLEETTLPPKAEFYSRLTQQEVSQEDYDHACNIWRAFGTRTLREFSNMYLKSDVTLLLDVFENFRDMCIEQFNLDPCQYYTTPGISFDAALKLTGVELELITDYEMHLLLESGIRGGSVQLVTRHAISNDEKLPDYDPNVPKKRIFYFDAVNLYGAMMCKKLPINGFKFEDPSKFDENCIMAIDPEGDKGYIFEVTLDYPENLHDEHNEHPFCPEMKCAPGKKQKKLLATLESKKHYVIHFNALQQALSHGLVLKHMHRVVSFNQSNWLRDYVEKNTKLRSESKSKFEISFWKWTINSVYGKMLERIRDRKFFTIVYTEKNLKKRLNKHNFLDFIIYSVDCVGVLCKKTKNVMDRPLYVGLAILDHAKVHMNAFFYDVIKKKFGKRATMLYEDTDSELLVIQSDDINSELKSIEQHFDFSNLPTDHPLFSNENRKVLGRFKDEMAGVPVLEFIGLRPKCYALR